MGHGERSIASRPRLASEIRGKSDAHAVRFEAVVIPIHRRGPAEREPSHAGGLIEPHVDAVGLHVVILLAPVLLQHLTSRLTDILRQHRIDRDGAIASQDRFDPGWSGGPQAGTGVDVDRGFLIGLTECRSDHRHERRARFRDGKPPDEMGRRNPCQRAVSLPGTVEEIGLARHVCTHQHMIERRDHRQTLRQGVPDRSIDQNRFGFDPKLIQQPQQ